MCVESSHPHSGIHRDFANARNALGLREWYFDGLMVGTGRGTARAEDAQGTPTQGHTSPSILVDEDGPQVDDA